MDLKNSNLEIWLKDAPDISYNQGRKVDYYSYYITLKDYLNERIHKFVTSGANLLSKDEKLFLNDHGVDHIACVIERASQLVNIDKCDLNALEVYLILVSIQLHDAGNILGRKEHELNADEILKEANNRCGRDDIERKIVKKIVNAHGGKIKGITHGEDKISRLERKEYLRNEHVRLQMIASIVRFADELADDKTRACITLLEKKKLPKNSEIFHAYSYSLDSVIINHEDRAIELRFEIPKEFLLKKFGKKDKEVYLIDEIYNRIIKMHRERMYCMYFFRDIINIEKIVVYIKFYNTNLEDIFPALVFEVKESGFPKENENEIYDLCNALVDSSGIKKDGEYMKKLMEAIVE